MKTTAMFYLFVKWKRCSIVLFFLFYVVNLSAKINHEKIDSIYLNIVQEKDFEKQLQIGFDYYLQDDYEEKVAGLNAIIFSYGSMGVYDKALYYSQELNKIAIKKGDIENRIRANRRIGTCYDLLGFLDKRDFHTLKALELINKVSNKDTKHVLLGSIYTNLNRFLLFSKKAEDGVNINGDSTYYLKKSIQEYTQIQDLNKKNLNLVASYNDACRYYVDRNLDSTLYYAQKLKMVAEHVQFSRHLADAYYYNSKVLYAKQKYDSALIYTDKAWQIEKKKLHQPYYLEKLYSQYIDIYEKLENDDLKIKYIHLKEKLQDSLSVIRKKNVNYAANYVFSEKQKKQWGLYVIGGVGILFLIGRLFYFKRKSFLEKESNSASVSDNSPYLSKAIGLAKQNSNKFRFYIDQIYPSFTKDLLIKYPGLSNKNIYYLAMLKVGLSKKEIAKALDLSTKSIPMKEKRIREKINLESNRSLKDWINEI